MVQAQLYLDLLPYEFKFDFSWKLFLYIEIRRGYWTVLDGFTRPHLRCVPETQSQLQGSLRVMERQSTATGQLLGQQHHWCATQRQRWRGFSGNLISFQMGRWTPKPQWPNGPMGLAQEIGKSVQDSCRFVRDFFFAQALETWKPSIIVQGQFSIP